MDTKSIAAHFTLGKNERLKSRKLIGQLFNEGKQVTSYPFRALFLTIPGITSLQAGFTVSSKNFKRAVDRNRIKRLMREAYRKQKRELLRNDLSIIVFFIYTGKEMIEFETTLAKMNTLIKAIGHQINEPAS